MSRKVTRDTVVSYLRCKTKAHLKLLGEQGMVSDHETLLTELRVEVRAKAVERVLSRHGEGEVLREVLVNASALKRGAPYLLDLTIEDGSLCLTLDGLKRVPGQSGLGDFHYAPVLFYEGEKVRQEQRQFLAVLALVVGGLQGREPGVGIVFHGKECRASRVQLTTALRDKARRVLREVKEQQAEGKAPRLVLNGHCQVCEFRERCRAQALRDDDLSLLRGMGEKEVRSYARKGIFTVTQLAHTFRPRRRGKRAKSKERHNYPLQALAIRDRKTYVLGSLQVPDAPVRVYLDLEGKPEEGLVYLVGAVVAAGGVETRHSFWADGREQETQIFEQFLAVVRPYSEFRVFCYGSYERDFLRRMRTHAKRKRLADKVLANTVNVLSVLYGHVHFPVLSNGLKDVGGHLGCSWTEPDASGIQSLVWRARWEQTGDEGLKQKLVTYNLEDCAALKRVTEFLFGVAAKGAAAGAPAETRSDGCPVPDVQDADKMTFPARWGPASFFHPDFAHITKCSYFDYQRQRVYVRTSQVVKKARVRDGKRVNRKLRASRRLTIEGRCCPHCKAKDFTPIPRSSREVKDPRSKRAFDLVFTPSGVRRRVIECRTIPYRCRQCGTAFLPEEYERLDKHFHGLKSWAMYEHVAHGVGFFPLEERVRDLFGLRVHPMEFHMFKSLLARYYRPTYNKLLATLLAGKVLHADETEVDLRTGKAYVWVFASMEEVVFMYRPNREGAFLRDLLKDFRGVLVSDFYAAYDALPCPQQKCLIHLMRDMNQDLLNNPFDEELQSLTGAFGRLLRAVVETIDQHGLKKRHLEKHGGAVAGFLDTISSQTFRSEVAEALRQRLLRCREKLFTFLRYDGVPWNNTNAENAIKRFAAYREGAACSLREAGLRDYLVLLSICHTCRYRGVSFLKFLLSRERDLDRFCTNKKARRPRPVVEVYPKGFTPPHLVRLRKAKPGQGPCEEKVDILPDDTGTPPPSNQGQ
jgi:predicted RecB family nuclease